MEGKVHKVTRRYILATYGAGTPRPIPIKFGVRIAPRNVINVSNFCNRIFRGFRSTGVKVSVFPLTLLVIVTTVLRYCAACDNNVWNNLPDSIDFSTRAIFIRAVRTVDFLKYYR